MFKYYYSKGSIYERGFEVENQQYQTRNFSEIIREMVQAINNNDIKKAAEILSNNLDRVNKILQDSGLQDALRNYYKPGEEFSILLRENDYDIKTLTIKVMMDLILREQVNLTQYSNREIDKLNDFVKECTWGGTEKDADLYLKVDDNKFREFIKSEFERSQIIKFKNVLRSFLDSETDERELINLKEQWREIFDSAVDRKDVTEFMNNLRQLFYTDRGEDRIIILKKEFRKLFKITKLDKGNEKRNYSNEDEKRIRLKEEFVEFFDSEVSNDRIIKLEMELKKFFDSEKDQIIKYKNDFLKLSEPFVEIVNLVKRKIDHILSNLSESENEHKPYKFKSDLETISALCLFYLRMNSKNNELKPLYDSYKDMVNFVKGMKDLLVNHRSMLKAKYLYNPNNKKESLYNADEILDTCLKFLKSRTPEDIIDRLDTIFCCSGDDLSGLYCMKDPETALGRMLTLYNRFYDKFDYSKINSSFLYHSNNSYIRDDFYFQREYSQNFWEKNEIMDAIKEAWPELANSLDKNISTSELRALIERAIVIDEYCDSPLVLLRYDKDSLIEIFSLCKDNSQRFNFSYEDLLNDKYVTDIRPYYEGKREEFEKLVKLATECTGQKVAIYAHWQLDPAAYASLIALGLLMEKNGAKVSLYNPSVNQVISYEQTLRCFGLQDIDGNDLVKINSNIPEGEYFDQVVLLDCDEDIVGDVLPKDNSTYFSFAHNEGNNFVQALATCEFIEYLYLRLNQDENYREIDHFESNILLDQSLKVESLIPTILYTGFYMGTEGFYRKSKNLSRLIERLERENRFLALDVAYSLVEYAYPNSYLSKFADYLISNNRILELNNGLGLIVFDETDLSRFPDMSLGVITNYGFSLPDDYIRIFPPTKGRREYTISFSSSKKDKYASIKEALLNKPSISFIPSPEEDYKAINVAEVFGGGGNQDDASCTVDPEDLLNPEYTKDIVKRITGWSNDKYEESELARNLEKLRSDDDNDVRFALRAIALSRGDYVAALKLSCPSFSLLEVGGIYINKYVASLALILETIPYVYNDEVGKKKSCKWDNY